MQGEVEHVTVVVQARDVVARQRVAGRLGVDAETLDQQLGRGRVGLGDVDPHPAVVPREQPDEVRGASTLGHPGVTVDPHHADVRHEASVGAAQGRRKEAHGILWPVSAAGGTITG